MKDVVVGAYFSSKTLLEDIIERAGENVSVICVPHKKGIKVHGVTSCAHEAECMLEGANIASDGCGFTIGSVA
jgi:hypothetical protein